MNNKQIIQKRFDKFMKKRLNKYQARQTPHLWQVCHFTRRGTFVVANCQSGYMAKKIARALNKAN